MTFTFTSSDNYVGSETFPWSGRVEPKLFSRVQWLLPRYTRHYHPVPIPVTSEFRSPSVQAQSRRQVSVVSTNPGIDVTTR